MPQRSFSYDSLSRLTSANNPESGTVGYSYDSIGNVIVKTDARGISGIFAYDQLNRLIAKRFTDGTPTVYYLFDGGVPTSSTSTPSTGSVTIAGAEQSFIPDCLHPPCARVYDHGTISITVGGTTKSTTYGATSTPTNLASALASAFNSDVTSSVSATSSVGTISFASRFTGATTNYPLSAGTGTSDPLDFPGGSFGTTKSGMSGGSGTCTGTGITLTVAYGSGRRSGMCDAAGAEAWSFDTMGRPLSDQRTTSGVTKSVGYSYNLDSSLATVVYPTGKTITYTANAAGHLVSAVDTGNSVNYATAASYAPQGSLSTLALGASGGFAGIQINDSYNNRLQPVELKTWSTAGVASDLVYSFVDAGNHNNGNVVQITNNKDASRTQNFTYDQVNRIATAKTAATSGQNCWSYSFSIDQWSNLSSAQPLSGYSCTQTSLSLSVNTKNQVTNTGFSYDAAGNTLGDGSNSYSWDAESRMKSAAGVNYTYDGDGRRVQKSSGKLYWYGTSADVLLETDVSGNLTSEYVFFNGTRTARRDSSSNVFYYITDHLGTTRVITTSSGVTCYESDFQPYGTEAVVITNTCAQYYKFTGKERDSESGLDDFGARYMTSSLGRFVSPDPLMSSGRPNNPQTWNRYAYVLNNPLNAIDPTGLYEWGKSLGGQKSDDDVSADIVEKRNEVRTAVAQAQAHLTDIKQTFGENSKEYTDAKRALDTIGTEHDAKTKNVFIGVNEKQSRDGNTQSKDGKGNIYITFKSAAMAAAGFQGLLAHEGFHAWESASGSHLGNYDSEFSANRVEAAFGRIIFPKGAFFILGSDANERHVEFWNPSWADADRTGNRDKAIRELLTTPTAQGGYGFKPPKDE